MSHQQNGVFSLKNSKKKQESKALIKGWEGKNPPEKIDLRGGRGTISVRTINDGLKKRGSCHNE